MAYSLIKVAAVAAFTWLAASAEEHNSTTGSPVGVTAEAVPVSLDEYDEYEPEDVRKVYIYSLFQRMLITDASIEQPNSFPKRNYAQKKTDKAVWLVSEAGPPSAFVVQHMSTRKFIGGCGFEKDRWTVNLNMTDVPSQACLFKVLGDPEAHLRSKSVDQRRVDFNSSRTAQTWTHTWIHGSHEGSEKNKPTLEGNAVAFYVDLAERPRAKGRSTWPLKWGPKAKQYLVAGFVGLRAQQYATSLGMSPKFKLIDASSD